MPSPASGSITSATSSASFEQRVAALMRSEDAVLCSSGYTANVGLLQSFAPKGAPVFLDMKAHISLHEGVLSAGAKPILFRHNDPDVARAHAQPRTGPAWSPSMRSTARTATWRRSRSSSRFASATAPRSIVDETHSFGAQGPNGAGLVVAAGLAERVHFRTVGLSKAVASRGGIIACSRRNAEYFRYESLPAIFSTSVMQHEVAGFDAVLDIFEKEGWRRQALHANHAYLKSGLDRLGYNVEASKTQIIALEAGDIRQTTHVARCLGNPWRFRRNLLPASDAREALSHPLHPQLRPEPARARSHHRGLLRHSRRSRHGRVALDAAQGARRRQDGRKRHTGERAGARRPARHRRHAPRLAAL